MNKKNNDKPITKKSKKGEILGIVLIAVSIFLAVALLSHDPGDWPGSSRAYDEPSNNMVGRMGAYVSFHIREFVGFTSCAFVLLMGITGIVFFLHKKLRILLEPAFFLLVTGMFLPLLVALTVDIGADNTRVEPAFRYGGILGGFFAHYMVIYLGKIGAYLVSIASILISLVLTTRLKPSTAVDFVIAVFGPIVNFIVENIKNLFISEKPLKRKSPIKFDEERYSQDAGDDGSFPIPFEEEIPSEPFKPGIEPTINYKMPKFPESEPETFFEESEEKIVREEDYKQFIKKEGTAPIEYVLPDLDLLDEPENEIPVESREEMFEQAQRIVESLRHFNIESEVKQITPGPIVTRYEITLAPGIKVGRILGLSNDLTMALRARGGIRIIAPIPGKAAIGIEVPNKLRSLVYFREIAESEAFQNADQPLVMAIGKNTSGDTVVADLAKMPHLLIAGSTGSGKSVCIHTILASILMKATPEEVRIILVDPKVVELNIYDSIPHLLASVITDPKRAAGSLKWAVREMGDRYHKLASLGVRDIYQYNEKVAELIDDYNNTIGTEDTEDKEGIEKTEIPEHLPLIVIIIDEFADLMLVASNEIEESIARLAQMARAVGMHLILATQRPSADIITGVIKANFPSRIAFKVMQASNSRIILDEGGADKLLGMGDMLFLQVGKPESIRLHGAYISNEESKRIIDFVSVQYKVKPEKIKEELLERESEETDNVLGLRDPNEKDPLFFEAARLVVMHSQGSVSLLQRRLKIGYARAARLIDQLELAGIVSPYDGSKAREVLVDAMYIDELEAGEI